LNQEFVANVFNTAICQNIQKISFEMCQSKKKSNTKKEAKKKMKFSILFILKSQSLQKCRTCLKISIGNKFNTFFGSFNPTNKILITSHSKFTGLFELLNKDENLRFRDSISLNELILIPLINPVKKNLNSLVRR